MFRGTSGIGKKKIFLNIGRRTCIASSGRVTRLQQWSLVAVLLCTSTLWFAPLGTLFEGCSADRLARQQGRRHSTNSIHCSIEGRSSGFLTSGDSFNLRRSSTEYRMTDSAMAEEKRQTEAGSEEEGFAAARATVERVSDCDKVWCLDAVGSQ